MLTDDERREVASSEWDNDWNCGRVDPLPGVPMVRVVDEHGKELARGYYIHHVNRNLGPFGRYPREGDVDHLVAMDGFADWNLPQNLEIKKVTPPHRIEVMAKPEIERNALLALANELESEGLDGWASGPVDVSRYARCIREAVGA